MPDGKYQCQKKQTAIRLDIIPDENRFKLTSKLPTGSRAIVKKTDDLLSWSVARNIPSETVFLELPIEAEANQAQFFRLRFDN